MQNLSATVQAASELCPLLCMSDQLCLDIRLYQSQPLALMVCVIPGFIIPGYLVHPLALMVCVIPRFIIPL